MPPLTVRHAHHTREVGQLCRWCVFLCAAEEVICCVRWCFSSEGLRWGAGAGPMNPPHCCRESTQRPAEHTGEHTTKALSDITIMELLLYEVIVLVNNRWENQSFFKLVIKILSIYQ